MRDLPPDTPLPPHTTTPPPHLSPPPTTTHDTHKHINQHQDFISVLEQAGAGSISFNPITGPNTVKALTAIAESEGYHNLDHDLAQGLAQGAGGDLRNAIQNLQMMLQGPVYAAGKGAAPTASKKGGRKVRQQCCKIIK